MLYNYYHPAGICQTTDEPWFLTATNRREDVTAGLRISLSFPSRRSLTQRSEASIILLSGYPPILLKGYNFMTKYSIIQYRLIIEGFFIFEENRDVFDKRRDFLYTVNNSY